MISILYLSKMLRAKYEKKWSIEYSSGESADPASHNQGSPFTHCHFKTPTMSSASFRGKGSGLRELRHFGNMWSPCLALLSSSPSRSNSSHRLDTSVGWFQLWSQRENYAWGYCQSGNWKTDSSWWKDDRPKTEKENVQLFNTLPFGNHTWRTFCRAKQLSVWGLDTGCINAKTKSPSVFQSSGANCLACSGSSFVINIYMVDVVFKFLKLYWCDWGHPLIHLI